MTADIIDIDGRLLNDFQRNVPITARPFAAMAERLEIGEADVIARLKTLLERGAITRFGATCRPNTAGASTLAAVAAPEWGVEKAAGIINSQVGVNHSYLREHEWNIWFVVTGPNRAHVDHVLDSIGAATGLRVLDLRLVEPFNIDLGFDLNGARAGTPATLRPHSRPAARAGGEMPAPGSLVGSAADPAPLHVALRKLRDVRRGGAPAHREARG